MSAAEDKQAFVNALVQEHDLRLRRFLAARLRSAAAELPDLIQEIYMRLLRVPSHHTIRSPRAYLFTVALHVLHQHRLHLAAQPQAVDLADVLSELEARGGENPATQFEVLIQLDEFEQVLKQLPPQVYTVFVLHRGLGYSREEIARRLRLSLAMVKKLLAQALVHCRLRFEEME